MITSFLVQLINTVIVLTLNYVGSSYVMVQVDTCLWLGKNDFLLWIVSTDVVIEFLVFSSFLSIISCHRSKHPVSIRKFIRFKDFFLFFVFNCFHFIIRILGYCISLCHLFSVRHFNVCLEVIQFIITFIKLRYRVCLV